MATDNHGMGIPLPADSTRIQDFPEVARAGFEKVAELLAGGMTEGMTGVAAAAVDIALDAADIITGDDDRVPARTAHADYADVTTDAAGRISEGTKLDGRKYIAQAEIDAAEIETLTVNNFVQAGQAVSQVDFSGYSRISTDMEDRVAEDALDAGGRVPAWVLAAWAERMGPALRAELGTAPVLSLSAFGDSMTAGAGGGGTTWPAVAAAALGWTHYNGGISSQTSTEIALRQGGLDVRLVLDGGTIPAAGPVTVSKISPAGNWRPGAAWTFPGTLAGVPGVLAKSAAEVWTFTRTTAGAAVPCAPDTKFLSAAAGPYNTWVNVFWTGRNNTVKANILRDTAAMVDGLPSANPRYLVLGVCNTTGEVAGGGGYNSVLDINAALSLAYGPRYFDVRRYLIDYGLQAAGITPTAADTAAITEDRLPPSLMSDTIHLTAAGYRVVGNKIAAIITEKGWNQ